MSEQNKRLVREITDVIWNRRSLDRIPEFYAPDTKVRPFRASDSLMQFLQTL